jgi:hypothetical protein
MKTSTSLTILGLAALSAALLPAAIAKPPHSIELTAIGSVAAGEFLKSAAEIAAHDPLTQRVFVVNAQLAQIDVVDISDPTSPAIVDSIAVQQWGAVANSVSVHDGIIAVAVEADAKTDPGHVFFFGSDLQFLSAVEVGALPDMLTFTPNGRYVLVANEGEPSNDYSIDPEGLVSIIDLAGGAASLTQESVSSAGFGSFTKNSLPASVRIYGPNATVAQDIEPEYITVSNDSKTAWVTLQENNAIATVPSATVTRISGLGTKDHSLAVNGFGSGNKLDASDRDGIPVANNGRINITIWPVKGFYLPDGIASYKVDKMTYLVLVNEGDTRDWVPLPGQAGPGYSEEIRIGSMSLDPAVFPTAVATELKKTSNLGRLKATSAQGFKTDAAGNPVLDSGGKKIYSEIFTFGARSFSIRTTDGDLVWDSGDQFEKITAEENPAFFNSNNEINKFDDRSDDKGPEPEGVALGKIGGRTYAFIGLERIGGIMVYDVTKPTEPEFVQYINNRDFTKAVDTPEAGDLGPEGVLFIAGEDSPNGKPLLVVSNEVSGTTTIYEINKTN